MEITEYREQLIREYRRRDVGAMIRLVRELTKEPFFPQLVRQWQKAHKVGTANLRVEDVADILLREAAAEIKASGELAIEGTYFMIGEDLKRLFNEQVSGIYQNTKMPGEFLSKIRAGRDQGDSSKLSDNLVNQYKNELIRIEEGRRALVEVLQQYSNLPIHHVTTLTQLLNQLHTVLKSNYKYITLKPYLASIYQLQGSPGSESSMQPGSLSLFRHYVNTGEEPELFDQLKLQLAVNNLLLQIKKQEVLDPEEFKKYWDSIAKIWSFHCKTDLNLKVRHILEQLLIQINADQDAILKRLARTFVAEYRAAEEQMNIRRRLIQNELACTKEYLKRVANDPTLSENQDEERIRIAQEKLIGLKGIIQIPISFEQAAAAKALLELERNALAISTAISAGQITDWIRIYSILFSNAEFFSYADETVDFSTMRELISNLSTYHLILNISQLKEVVDRSLKTSEEEKSRQFKRFHEALKLKLQGLIGKNTERKSIMDMIRDLEFLENEAIQFVVADTFKGFQIIADAFTATANDFFVKDREALIKESRELYHEICDQCLKNFVQIPTKPVRKNGETAVAAGKQKKSLLGRLFQG